jgi:hypothetical protein
MQRTNSNCIFCKAAKKQAEGLPAQSIGSAQSHEKRTVRKVERPKSREETPKMGDSDAAQTARAAKVHMILFAVTDKNPAFASQNDLGKVVLRPQLESAQLSRNPSLSLKSAVL